MSGKPKLLITGGLGNLGSWLSEYFSCKYDVHVLSKNIHNKLNCKYKLLQADISNLENLKLKLNIEFDFCIHTASYNEHFHENYSEKAIEVNTIGTRNLIEVLKDTKIKNFIYLSTFHVYGASSGLITEDSKLNPKNDYASTHLFAEFYLRQFLHSHDFKSVIFRLTNSYGAPKFINSTKWYLVLNDLAKSAYDNQVISLKGNGKAVRDLIWMGDVCSVLDHSLNMVSSDIYNLSSGKTYQMMDLAKKIQVVYKKRYQKKIEIITSNNDDTKFLELKVDNSKIKKTLNFEFNDNLTEEIDSIFDLLDKNKHLVQPKSK
jgi:UDP-glucose 4-epimerase